MCHETETDLYLVLISVSAVSCSPQSLTLLCPAQGRVKHRGVLLAAESDFAVSSPVQSQAPRCLALLTLLTLLSLSQTDTSVFSPAWSFFCYFKNLTPRCPAQPLV